MITRHLQNIPSLSLPGRRESSIFKYFSGPRPCGNDGKQALFRSLFIQRETGNKKVTGRRLSAISGRSPEKTDGERSEEQGTRYKVQGYFVGCFAASCVFYFTQTFNAGPSPIARSLEPWTLNLGPWSLVTLFLITSPQGCSSAMFLRLRCR